MLKEPLNFEDQTIQLDKHGVIIKDFDLAEKILNEVNYYRLTGYLISIRKSKNDSDLKQKVDFDKLYSTYKMDNELKNFLFNILIKIELNLRTIIAYEYSMSKCISPPHDQHYDKNNYYNKKGFYDVLNSLEKTKNYNKDSLVIKHHKKNIPQKCPYGF